MNQPVESGTCMSNQEQDNVMVNEHYGISKEAFAKYAADLGVTDVALPNIFKILEQNKVDPADLGEKLHETAESYKKLLESLLRQARESIEGKDVQGNSVTIDFSKAKELLQQAQELSRIVVLPMDDVLTPGSTGKHDYHFNFGPGISALSRDDSSCIPCTTATEAYIPKCCPPK